MTAFGTFDFADLRRWAISGAVVAAAHGAVAAGIVAWREPADESDPAAAMVVHLALVPVAPAAPQTDLAPGPRQDASDAALAKPGEIVEEEKIEEKAEHRVEAKLRVEERTEAKPVEVPPPEVPPAVDPDVPIEPEPAAQEVRREQPQQQAPSVPVAVTTAPEALPVETGPIPAAPEQGKFRPSDSRAVQAWQKQIVALLERNKRYPPAAQSRRLQGVAQVFFALDREGRVVESRIVRSSGAAPLDEEALALIRRAQPFPAWPAREFAGARVDLTVPIRFNLR